MGGDWFVIRVGKRRYIWCWVGGGEVLFIRVVLHFWRVTALSGVQGVASSHTDMRALVSASASALLLGVGLYIIHSLFCWDGIGSDCT